MRNVHVVDRRLFTDPSLCDSFIDTLQASPGQNLVLRVSPAWSIDRICRRVRQGSHLGVLRIYCHGNASYIQLAQGLSRPAQTVNFRLLRDIWEGRHPRIEIHACGVVSSTEIACLNIPIYSADMLPAICTPGVSAPNTPGRQLVQAIADNAGALAIAALNAQAPLNRGFEGRVVYCRPARYYRSSDLIGTG
jgi:hypothetical protein